MDHFLIHKAPFITSIKTKRQNPMKFIQQNSSLALSAVLVKFFTYKWKIEARNMKKLQGATERESGT